MNFLGKCAFYIVSWIDDPFYEFTESRWPYKRKEPFRLHLNAVPKWEPSDYHIKEIGLNAQWSHQKYWGKK